MLFQTSSEQIDSSRQVYNSLDFVGDIGGLFDGLKAIGFLLVTPFSGFSFVSKLFAELFYVQAHEKKERKTHVVGTGGTNIEQACREAQGSILKR